MDSIEKYQQKTRKQKNLDDLAVSITKKEPHTQGGNPPKGAAKALAAKIAEQCKYHLMPNGCRWSETCNLGRHDPECKGMGSGKGGGKESGKGKSTGKSESGKGKSKGEKGQPKGGKAGKRSGDNPAPQSLPDDAIKDSKGRFLC